MKRDGKASAGQTIKFSDVIGNTGRSFNKNSGEFTTVIPGIYFFTFSATSDASWSATEIDVMKNNQPDFVIAYNNRITSLRTQENMSYSWMMNLKAQDKIRLRLRISNLDGSSKYPVTFTAHLLFINE